MKISNRLKVASYNFSAKSSYFFSLSRYLTFIISLLLITALISAFITNSYNELIYGDIYDCKFTCEPNSAEDLEQQPAMQQLKEIPELTSPSVYSLIDATVSSGNSTDEYINLNRVTLVTENKTFRGTDDRTFNFAGNTKKHTMLGINCYLSGYTVFSEIQKQAFSFYHPNRTLIRAGREMSDDHEMMMSDYIIDHFGITDYVQVLNQKISLYIDDIPYLTDYTLTGIVDSDFYKIMPDTTEYDADFYSAQVLLCCNENTFSELGAKHIKAEYYPKQYGDLPEIIKNITEQNLDEALSYEANAGSQYLLTLNVKQISGFIILLLVIFISLAMALQIISVSSNDMKGQESYLAMLRAIGIQKKELFGIVFFEHLLTVLASAIAAVLLSMLFLLFANLCFMKIFEGGIAVNAAQFMKINLQVIPTSVAAYLLLISLLFFFEQRKTIHEMLK